MPALAKALRRQSDPIPTPWFSGMLERGSLALLGAGGGVGKSFVALRWALHLAERGYPVLYQSNDTPLKSQGVRLYSLAFGQPAAPEAAARWLSHHELPLRWSDMTIGTRDLDGLIAAESMYFGQSPALVVIDVLGDFVSGDEDVAKVRRVVSDLKQLARDHNCGILALHHLTGYAMDGDQPVKLSDFRYEKGGIGEVYFGMWRWGAGRRMMKVLKNRNGEGGQVAEILFDPGVGRVEYSG